MNDERVLICPRVEEDPAGYVIPGTVEGACAQCGAKVRVSPSGQDLLRDERPMVLCTECALALMDQTEEAITVNPMTDKQREELQGYLKRN